MLHIFNKKFNLEDIIFSNFMSNISNTKNNNGGLEKNMGKQTFKKFLITSFASLTLLNPLITKFTNNNAHALTTEQVRIHNEYVKKEEEKRKEKERIWKIESIRSVQEDIKNNIDKFSKNIEDFNRMNELLLNNPDEISSKIYNAYFTLLSSIENGKYAPVLNKMLYSSSKYFNLKISKFDLKNLPSQQVMANLFFALNTHFPDKSMGYTRDLFENNLLNAKNSHYEFQRLCEVFSSKWSIPIINQNIYRKYLTPDKNPVQYFRTMMEISPNNRNKINMPPQIYQDFSKLALLAGLSNNPEHISYFINKEFLKDERFMTYIDNLMLNNKTYSTKDRIEISETMTVRRFFNSMIKKNIPFADEILVKKATNELKRKQDIIANHLAQRIYAKANF